MPKTARADGRKGQPFAPRQRDDIANRLRRQRCRHQKHRSHSSDGGDGREILDRIVGQPCAQARVHRMAWEDHQQRMAIWFRARHGFRADNTPGTGAVFDNHLPAKPRGQTFGHQTRQHIGDAARTGRHDDPHRACWIGLRIGRPRQYRECSAQGQCATTC